MLVSPFLVNCSPNPPSTGRNLIDHSLSLKVMVDQWWTRDLPFFFFFQSFMTFVCQWSSVGVFFYSTHHPHHQSTTTIFCLLNDKPLEGAQGVLDALRSVVSLVTDRCTHTYIHKYYYRKGRRGLTSMTPRATLVIFETR